jgi:hypothetical protein
MDESEAGVPCVQRRPATSVIWNMMSCYNCFGKIKSHEHMPYLPCHDRLSRHWAVMENDTTNVSLGKPF